MVPDVALFSCSTPWQGIKSHNLMKIGLIIGRQALMIPKSDSKDVKSTIKEISSNVCGSVGLPVDELT